MQSVDFTTLIASCTELRHGWLPARLEQFYQTDRYSVLVALRTLKEKAWLTLSWHPQAARICLGDPPPREPDTFTFSEQLRHQLNGLTLTDILILSPWERVVDLRLAKRPGDPPIYHLYLEVMGKYSNLILTDNNNQVITVAHQVGPSQSSIRTVQTGQSYTPPPPVLKKDPNQTFVLWQENIKLIPGQLQNQLLANYQGLSPVVARTIIEKANLECQSLTDTLTEDNWQTLYKYWSQWLETLEKGQFQPGLTQSGYTVLGSQIKKGSLSTQKLLNSYYSNILKQEQFNRLLHQLKQKISNLLSKLKIKQQEFSRRLQQAELADNYQEKANLLMANLHQWQPGLSSITLADFTNGEPVTIALQPDKNMIANAQNLYKQSQKLKRVHLSVQPLLEETQTEIDYLANVLSSLDHLEKYQNQEDFVILEEIQRELIAQKYLEVTRAPLPKEQSQPHRHLSPSGFELIIGRNNRQNDQITFSVSGNYDLWFHTQQVPSSHVLLRVPPGSKPEEVDLQFAADWTAYYSQARLSQQVPVIYTLPKYVYKPKGSKPGMVIYKNETVIWGCPDRVGKKNS